MKVEVKVLREFDDLIYDKHREVNDVFICDKELAIKRKNFQINGQNVPLIKILGVASENSVEEEQSCTRLNMIKNLFKQNNKEEGNEGDN